MKKITTMVLALIMVAAMSASAFAAGISAKTAEKTALKNAKLSRSNVYGIETEYDHDDGVYEVEFTNAKNGNEYSYEISGSSGKIVEKSVDYTYKWNGSHKKIGKTKAYKKAAKISGVKLSTVKKGICMYEYDDGKGTYEVKFKSGKRLYEVEILAPTGKVIEYSWKVVRR